jgi:hypothetical protein
MPCRGRFQDLWARQSIESAAVEREITQMAAIRKADDEGANAGGASPYATLLISQSTSDLLMLLSKEYVGYLAREVTKKLLAGEFIATKSAATVGEKVHAAMLEEFSLEDRINDEVRVILEAYSEEMQKTGANYQEMFRKVKNELVRKYKAVL